MINLVAPNSIEETMVGKLRFKTSMFEGVLDEGEDSVFVDDDKFSKIMETVSSMVEECNDNQYDEDKESHTADTFVDIDENEEKAERCSVNDVDSDTANTEADAASVDDENIDCINESGADSSCVKLRKPLHPKELVAQGVSFLSGLAEALKSPESTAALVDSITEKDESTGEISVKIPVESKETVENLLNMIGKLFAR